jgi:DNA primase
LVVLVFDGDSAGQTAADRALEFFLGHELDVRILTLPVNLDPCDFLLKEGADRFRELVAEAVDPLAFVLQRAADRFDLGAIEGSRRAAEWVLGILSRVPSTQRIGMDLKLAKALDRFALRLGLPVDQLRRRLRELKQAAAPRRSNLRPAAIAGTQRGIVSAGVSAEAAGAFEPPARVRDLDPLDRELVEIVLNEPSLVAELISRVTTASLRDTPLRAILQACYDVYGEGRAPSAAEVISRLENPQHRALAAELLLPVDQQPMPDYMRPAPWQERFDRALVSLTKREIQHRIGDLQRALAETDAVTEPDAYHALEVEFRRLMYQRPDTKKTRPDLSFRA